MRERFIVIVLAGLGLACTAAFAGGDPPGRIARINYSEGVVSFAPAGDDEFVDADMSRPLVAGDKLWTDKGVRAEVQAGSAVVRMDGRTQLAVLAVGDESTQFAMAQGSLYVRVRNLPEGENFEIDTPNLAWRASYPGDYRIDVDPVRAITRVTIHSGTGAVYGDKGEALPMGGGQQITFKDRALAQVDAHDQPPDDNFDRWAQERNRRDDQSVAARYVPRDAVGYQLLDAKGEWRQDASYGVAWFPQGLPAKWAPYRNGRWEWIGPWGWTWIDQQPWAFVTSHYGRWALVNSKWAWVPGRLGVRPVYSPALVAFVGGEKGSIASGGKPAVAWFPLAPGEAWRPGWDASPLYISSVNANMTPQPPAQYAYQSKPEAVTAVAADDFAHGRPARGHWLHVADSALAEAQVVAPPAMPEHARSPMVAHAPLPAAMKAVAGGQPALVQRAVPTRAPAEPGPQRQVQRQAQAQPDADVQREQQAKAEQARAAAVQALAQRKAAEQQERIAVQQKAAGQQRQADRQKLAGQKRRDEQQKVAQQRVEQQRVQQARAKRAQAGRQQALARERQAQRELAAAKQRAQRELQARRAQEARRLATAAKQEEQARQVVHAQQVEQARRAAERDALMLAAQRAEREAALRRVADEKERDRAQREAWQKQQQAVAEQFRRDQQRYEEQQRQKAALQQRAARPDLRHVPAQQPPEVWQRGIPILAPGRTS